MPPSHPRPPSMPRARCFGPLALPLLVTLLGIATAGELQPGFESLFDGSTLRGWSVSPKSGHSRASNHTSGGRWIVHDGAIVGSQDIPGNGGLILTDASFEDFEVSLEMNNDFGPDSGLFLRSTEDGRAWQAMIDYHADGNLMGVYGEGLGGRPSVRSFTFGTTPGAIRPDPAPVPLPVLPAAWASFWRHGQWNELRARITGNPPRIETWINGVRFMDWTETEMRHPAEGRIGLQVHGGGDLTRQYVRYRNIQVRRLARADNELTDGERRDGWRLLFDGRSHDGWMNSNGTPPKTPVDHGSLNPYRAGHYMLVHTQKWEQFMLSLDFRISKGCNSGVFIHTSSLTPRPGRDVGFNGVEIAIDDTTGAGMHDTGALYDLAAPSRNAMKPRGEWNRMIVTSLRGVVEVELNGDLVNRVDLNRFTEPNRRPDGSTHKFDVAYREHPRLGYIGLQDHGSPVWFKNIKLRPIP